MTASTASPPTGLAAPPDPVNVLKAFASLRRLLGTYPSGHPMIAQKLRELDEIFGMLAFASEDSARFYPEMGTLYLKRIGEMVSAALLRFV